MNLRLTAICRPWAAALLAALAAGPSEAQDQPPLAYRRVFVPEAELSTQIRGLWPLRRDEFERRLQLAEKLAAPAGAAAARVTAGVYRAQYRPGQLVAGEALLEIAAGESETSALPLSPCSLALGSAQWQGSAERPAVVGVDPAGRLVCLVERSGTLKLTWTLAGQALAEGGTAFDLRFPVSPRCRLEVETDESERVAAETGLTSPAANSASRQRRVWSVELGGKSQTRLTIQPLQAPPAERSPVIVRESSNYAVQATGLDIETTLTLDILGPPLSALALAAAPGVQVTSIRLGEQSLEWTAGAVATASAVSDEQLLAVVLPAPMAGLNRQVQVTAVAEWPAGQRCKLPRIRAAEGVLQDGQVTISAPPWQRLEARSLSDCAQTAMTPAGAGRPLDLYQFQLFADAAEIEIAAHPQAAPLREQSGAEIRIDATQVSGVLLAELSSLGGERYAVEAVLPRHWLIDAVETQPPEMLADRQTTARGAGEQVLRLNLARALTESRPLKLLIRGHYRRPAGQRPLPADFFRLASFPAATDGRRLITVRITDPVTELKLTGDERLQRLSASQLTAAEARLFESPPSGILFVAGKGSESLRGALVPSTPKYAADVLIQAHADRTLLRQVATIRCQPASAAVGSLLVRLLPKPAGSVAWRLAGDDTRELNATPLAEGSDDEAVYRVSLARPRTMPFELRGEWSAPLGRGADVSVCWLPEASTHTGLVEVYTRGGGLEIQAGGVERLPAPAAAAERFSSLAARFRYEPGRRASLRVIPTDRRQAQPAAWIERLDLTSRFAADGGGEHEALLAVVNSGLEELRLQLPPGIANLRATDDSGLAAPPVARNIAGAIAVALPPHQRQCRIRLHYSSTNAPLGDAPLARWTAPVPQLAVPVLSGTWTVAVAPSLAILADDGRAAPSPSFAATPESTWMLMLGGRHLFSASSAAPIDESADPAWVGWDTHSVPLPTGAAAAISVYRPASFRVWAVCLGLAGGAVAVWRRWRGFLWLSVCGLLIGLAWAAPAPWSWLAMGLALGLAAGGLAAWARPQPGGPNAWQSLSGSTIVLAGGQASSALLVAICACHPHWVCAAAPDQHAAKRWRVVIAVDADRQPVGDYVYLEPEFYEALHKLTSAESWALPVWLLERGRYELPSVPSGTAARPALDQVRCSFDLLTYRPQATVALPFRRNQVSLLEGQARLDGQPVTLNWSEAGDSLALAVESPGRHRLELALGAALQATADGLLLDVEIPAAGQAAAILPTASRAEIARGAGPSETDGLLRSIPLAVTRQLAVRWPDAHRPVGISGGGEVEQLLWWRIRPGSAVVEGRFVLRPRAGAVREILLAVDPRLRLIAGSGGSAVTRVVPVEGSSQLMRVELAEPAAAERTLKLSWLWPDAGGLGTLLLPAIAVQAERVPRSWLAASVDPQWSAEFAGHGAGPPSPAEFAAAWGENAAPPAVACDRGGESEEKLVQLHIVPRPGEAAVEQAIDWSLSGEAATVHCTFRLTGVPQASWSQRLSLPAQLRVQTASIEQAGRPAALRWMQDADGTLTLTWLEPPATAQQWTITALLPVARQRPRLPLPAVRLAGGSVGAKRLRIFRQEDVQITLQDAAGWTKQDDPQLGQHVAGLGRLVAALHAGPGAAVQPRVGRTPNQARTAGDLWLRVQEDDGDWRAEALLDLDVSGGLLDQLRLSVPAEWSGPFTVEPAMEHQLIEVAGESRRQLLLRPQFAAGGKLQVTVRGPLAAGPGGMQAPDVWAANLPADEAWQRFVLLDNRAGSARIDWRTTGLQSLPPGEAQWPAAWNDARGELHRAVAPQFTAVAHTRPVTAAQPSVVLADFAARLTAADRMLLASTFTIDPHGAAAATFTLPPGSRLIQVLLDGALAPASRAGLRTWTIAAPSAKLPYRLSVVSEGWLPRTGDALALAAPQLSGMQCDRTLWTVRADETNDLTAAGHSPPACAARVLDVSRLTAAAHVLDQLGQASDIPPDVLAESFVSWWRLYQHAHASLESSGQSDSRTGPAEQLADRARQRLLAAGILDPSDVPAEIWPAETMPPQSTGKLHFATAGSRAEIELSAPQAAGAWPAWAMAGLIGAGAGTAGVLMGLAAVRRWIAAHAQLLLATAGAAWWLVAPWGFVGWILVVWAAWLAVRWPWPRGAYNSGSTIRRFA